MLVKYYLARISLAVLAILIDPPSRIVLVRRSRALSWLRVQRMRSRDQPRVRLPDELSYIHTFTTRIWLFTEC